MFKRKRTLVLAGLTTLLAVLAFAAPAHAIKVAGACVLAGEAKVYDKVDPGRGVLLTGGKGGFDFASSLLLTCVGVSKGEPAAEVMFAAGDGVYVNVVCGTGKAWGTVTELVGPEKYRNLLLDHKFAIHFFGAYPEASEGVFFWHEDKMKTDLFDFKDQLESFTKLLDRDEKPKDAKHWQSAGTVRLGLSMFKLDSPRPEDNHCTKAMTVTATIMVFAE